MKPYTMVLPKPLMPIGEFPILEVIIRQLERHGFTHITLSVNHLAEIIRAFFGDGKKWNVHIDYVIEDIPLSTMGPLQLIRDLPENFLIMNGDVLTDLDFNALYEYHIDKENIFTISSCKRSVLADFGVLFVDGNETLSGFEEKPTTDHAVSMGIYIANRDILKHIPKEVSYGFDNLLNDLLKHKIPVSVRNYDGYWLDIGRPDDYHKAIEEFDSKRKMILGV